MAAATAFFVSASQATLLHEVLVFFLVFAKFCISIVVSNSFLLLLAAAVGARLVQFTVFTAARAAFVSAELHCLCKKGWHTGCLPFAMVGSEFSGKDLFKMKDAFNMVVSEIFQF